MSGRTLATEVAVVGAGPVGLMLAGELALGGVPTTVVERLPAPMTESRAAQLNARTMEILVERGLGALAGEARPEPVGHFAGIPLDVSTLDSPYAGHWKVPQYRTEAALAARATSLGAQLLRGHELRGLHDRDSHVLCDVAGPAGPVRVRARYVVGCDGAASTVRGLMPFPVRGTPATKALLRADVTGVPIPDRRFERLDGGLAIAATRDGVTRVMVHAFGAPHRNRAEPVSFEEFAATWAKVTGDDISAGHAIWVDAFDNETGHAGAYRLGRVLLAGDAAHWHMPIGGQSLNIGLQDAVNLGWKLVAQVRGWAPRGLLDTYHAERHPVAARVLENVRFQELLLLGEPEVEPARAGFAELLAFDNVREHVAALVSGLDVCYATG
jgi:2-polyprenyl-6-methoxyphenol hydroxylase-like FAD-dependent oxidoreductase